MPELIVRKWDGPYSFMVFREEGLYKARRGDNGSIQFQDPEIHEVLNDVWNALTPGRTWKETVVLKGDFSVSASIELPSYVTLDLTGAKLTLEGGVNDHLFKNANPIGGNSYIEVVGGIIDGNKDGQTVNCDIFYLSKVHHSIFREIRLINAKRHGLHFLSASTINWVNKCSFTGIVSQGIRLYGGSSDNIITENEGSGLECCVADYSGANIIANNKFYGGNGRGIEAYVGTSIITGNILTGFRYEGIKVTDFIGGEITNNYIAYCSRDSPNSYDAINLAGESQYVKVSNNVMMPWQGKKYHRYDIGEWGTSNYNFIEGNICNGSQYGIRRQGANTIFKGNSIDGKPTENSGTATIPNGQTSVTFAHDLPGTPTLVTLGATHSEVADAVWSADATNITITVPSAVTADRQVSWHAEYKP